jgi:hypothetical protein
MEALPSKVPALLPARLACKNRHIHNQDRTRSLLQTGRSGNWIFGARLEICTHFYIPAYNRSDE